MLSPEAEKQQLLKRLLQLQVSNPDAKVKWWSFCKVHGEGNFDAAKHDSAFLQTFFEAFELGEVPELPMGPDEPGFPFGDSKLQADGGQTATSAKVFVGGLPKATTEEALRQHFSYYGPVAQVDLKYDPEGGFRGFGFVTFQDVAVAQVAINDKVGGEFLGKWIDCKPATSPGSGPAKGGGGGDAKGGKCDKGGKGGKFDKGGYKGDKGGGGGKFALGGKDCFAKGFKDGGGKSPFPSRGDDACKIFVGAMPKSATPDSVTVFFSQFGTITNVDLKYDEAGGFRGFGFVTFSTPESMQAACINGPSNYLEGKWVDVKPAERGQKGGGKDGGKSEKGGKGLDKGGKCFCKGKGGKDWGAWGGGKDAWCGGKDVWGGGWGW